MRWNIRRVHVLHGRDGYVLSITDTAWWALAVGIANDRLLSLLGAPHAGRGLGRPDFVFNLTWSLWQSTAALEWKHTTRIVEMAVGEDVARLLWLGDWDRWQDLIAEESLDDPAARPAPCGRAGQGQTP